MSNPALVAGGVNLKGEEAFSVFAGQMCRRTFNNSRFITVVDLSEGHFRGPRGFRLNTTTFPILDEAIFTVASDGVGTKVIVVSVGQLYHSVPRDIVAMTGGDITRRGGCCIAFTNVLDVANLGTWNDDTSLALQDIL